MMARVATCLLLLAAACLGGCISATPLGEGEMDQMWRLDANPFPRTELNQPSLAGRTLPARWVIRPESSLILSTVSVVRGLDAIQAGNEEVTFLVSPEYTASAIRMLDEAKESLHDLEELAQAGESSDRAEWARALATALVNLDDVVRHVSSDGGQGREPSALAAAPLLEVFASYLDAGAGGGLLADLEPEEVGQIRVVLAQAVLKLGFDLAERQLPPDVRGKTVAILAGARNAAAAQGPLEELLIERLEEAPRRLYPSQAATLVRKAAAWGPKAIEVLQDFLRQWNKIDSMVIEYRLLGDRKVISVEMNVRPGKEVRIADVVIAQPALVFSGASRIVVVPSMPLTDEAAVFFEPVGGGSVSMRYEGIVYAFVRLLAVPLASGPLREIRVSAGSSPEGYQLLNVAMFSEARGDKADPRRLLVFQRSATRKLRREPFSVVSVDETSRIVFSYVTPARRYTYERVKGAPGATPP
jgi:hypothetical protein